jgi:ATP-dependent RNA helicase RhlE
LSFDQFAFNHNINAAIRAAGYSNPTPIQKQAIPLQGRDVWGSADGTGKLRFSSCPTASSGEPRPAVRKS